MTSATKTPRRTRTACVASERPTEVWDFRSGQVILEALCLSGATWPARPAPLLLDHDRSIRAQVGSVTGFRVVGQELLADLRFSSSDLADEAVRLVEEGHAGSVSVGYRRLEVRTVSPGRSLTVSGKTFTAPPDRSLQVTVRWEIKEVSLVSIAADETAAVRSAVPNTRMLSMPSTLPSVIGSRDVRHMSLADYLAVGLRSRNQPVPDNDRDVVRSGLSSVDGINDLLSLVNVSVLDGYRSVPDTLAGVYRFTPLPNFLAAELARVDVAPRLTRLVRGQAAPHISFSMTNQGWRLIRFGAQFVIGEEDDLDRARIGTFQTALEEVGKSARRLIPDLLYSLLLENPVLDSDSIALFDAGTHTNLSTAALASTSLDDGMAAISGRAALDKEGGPVHLGCEPRYLIVPPALLYAAKALVRTITTGNGDLVVRAENRISTTGVRDPRDNEGLVRTGLNTNWLLAAPAEQSPCLLVGTLNGKTEPVVRQFSLDRGEWGVGFDVKMDIGVCAADYRGLYWSTGTV